MSLVPAQFIVIPIAPCLLLSHEDNKHAQNHMNGSKVTLYIHLLGADSQEFAPFWGSAVGDFANWISRV